MYFLGHRQKQIGNQKWVLFQYHSRCQKEVKSSLDIDYVFAINQDAIGGDFPSVHWKLLVGDPSDDPGMMC